MGRPTLEELCDDLNELVRCPHGALEREGTWAQKLPRLGWMLSKIEDLGERAETLEYRLEDAIGLLPTEVDDGANPRAAMNALFDTVRDGRPVDNARRRPTGGRGGHNVGTRRDTAAVLLGLASWDTIRMRADGTVSVYGALAAILMESLDEYAPLEDSAIILGPLPSPRTACIGRAHELQRLHALVGNADVSEVCSAVIIGHPGVGKTRLAIEFVTQQRQDLDLVVFLEAGTTRNLDASITTVLPSMARVLGGPSELPGASDSGVRLQFRRLLAETTKRWTVVIDNVAGPEMVRGLFPHRAGGCVLMTSVWQTWEGSGVAEIELNPLQRNDGVALLQQLSGDLEPTGSAGLVRDLAGLPLALVQAGAYLADNPIGYADYRLLLESPSGAMLTDDVTGSNRSVMQAIRQSLDRANELEPLAGLVGGYLSVLAPRPVATAALEHFVRRDGSGGDGVDDEGTFDKARLERAVASLSRLSLVDRASRTVQMDQVTQRVIRAGLHESGDLLQVARLAGSVSTAMLEQARADDDHDLTTMWSGHVDHVRQVLDLLGDPGADELRAAIGRNARPMERSTSGPSTKNEERDGATRQGGDEDHDQ